MTFEQSLEQTSAPIYISETAFQVGYGSDRYKRVAGLTAAEKVMVKAGTTVFFQAERLSARGPSGTYWRMAKQCGRTIGPRVPTEDVVSRLRAEFGLL